MSMSGGKQSGSSSSSTYSPYAPILAQFGKIALPLFKEFASQTGEALKTGGVNAQIPIIDRSLDEARSAFSKSYENTRQALGRSNLGRGGFGQELLAGLGMAGREDIAKIPTDVASSFIAGTPALTSQGIGALGTAMAGNISTHGSYDSSNFGWEFDPAKFLFGAGQGAAAANSAGLI